LVTFSVLFPFMMLLPLRYTLFPYTTLFRSQGLQVDRVVVVGDHIGSGIELADPLVGTQPKPTVPIGQNAVYDLIGQAILHGKPLRLPTIDIIFYQAGPIGAHPKEPLGVVQGLYLVGNRTDGNDFPGGPVKAEQSFVRGAQPPDILLPLDHSAYVVGGQI